VLFDCGVMEIRVCVKSDVLNEILYKINILESLLFVEMTLAKT
jgi:hypothetical protein